MKFSILIVALGVAAVTSTPVDTSEKRLIKRADGDLGRWMTQAQIFELIENLENFIDITDDPNYPVHSIPSTSNVNGKY